MDKKIWIWGGVVVLLGGGFLLYRSKTSSNKSGVVDALTVPGRGGYSDLMNLGPQYYNAGSFEGSAFKTESFRSRDIPTPWVLGANPGDNMDIMGGWTDWGDDYSAKVSEQWQVSEAQGAHL